MQRGSLSATGMTGCVAMVIINRGSDFWWLWQGGTVKTNQEVGVRYVGSDNTPYLLSKLPKGTKSTGEKREGRVKVELKTHQQTFGGGLVHFKIQTLTPGSSPPLPLPFSCLLAQCDIGQYSTSEKKVVLRQGWCGKRDWESSDKEGWRWTTEQDPTP